MAENKNRGAIARRSTLYEIAPGENVELRELVLSDWAFMEEEAAQARKRDLIRTYAGNAEYLPESKREQLILDAFKRAEEITPDTVTNAQLRGFQETLKGRLLIIWLAMRGACPDVTYDQAAEIWQAHENHIREASDRVAELSLPTLGQDAKNESAPQTAGPS